MDVKKLPGWLYHAEHEPRIFHEQAEYDAALAAGWVDSPAKIESDEVTPTALPPEIADMDKDTLSTFAWERYGLNLDKRSSLNKLLQQVASKMVAGE